VCVDTRKDQMKKRLICTYDGCLERHYCRGFCREHYARDQDKKRALDTEGGSFQEHFLELERRDIGQYLIEEIFPKIPEREQKILELRIIKNYTLKAIATMFDISVERVRQIEHKGLWHLRWYCAKAKLFQEIHD